MEQFTPEQYGSWGIDPEKELDSAFSMLAGQPAVMPVTPNNEWLKGSAQPAALQGKVVERMYVLFVVLYCSNDCLMALKSAILLASLADFWTPLKTAVPTKDKMAIIEITTKSSIKVKPFFINKFRSSVILACPES